MKKIGIIGGGVTGLSAAYFLQTRVRELGEPARIVLIERDHRLGGKVTTEVVKGFTLEGGPDSMLTVKPSGMALCERLGLVDQLVGPAAGLKTFILRGRRLRRLPDGAMGFIPTHFASFLWSDLFSIRGKLRMGMELFVRASRDGEDESLGTFIRRRLGREPLDRLAEPLLAGVYAADANQLSLKASYPQLLALEQRFGSLIRGALASRHRPKSGLPLFMAPLGGLGQITERLANALDRVELNVGAAVVRLERRTGGLAVHLEGGHSMMFDELILTTPAFESSALLRPVKPELADELLAIPYASTAVVNLAFPRSEVGHPLDASGFLVPRSERMALTGCTWSSSKWPVRAPEGFVLFRAFFGRFGEEEVLELGDDALAALAQDELRGLVGLRGQPVLTRVHRWPRAMPQYQVGHLERIEQIEQMVAEIEGLHLAGAGYRGIGLPDCIAQAERVAQELFPIESRFHAQ